MIRRPTPITPARLNGIQDDLLDIYAGTLDVEWLVCSPIRSQITIDFTNPTPVLGAGWNYDIATGELVSSGGGAAFTDDDVACIGADLEAGDDIIGFRVLVKRLAIAPQIELMEINDGVFPPGALFVPTNPVTAFPMPAAGVWGWYGIDFDPYTIVNESFALHFFSSYLDPGNRIGMGLIGKRRV